MVEQLKGQISIFDLDLESEADTEIPNTRKLKLLSLFSGIGAFEKALTNLNVPFEVVNYCEIDKYASKAYSLIHDIDESLNLHDVTKIDTSVLPKDIDFVTYGFPCQDISISGKQQGFVNDNGELTRSGLFFEALRIIEDTKPKIAIAENVKALTSKKFTLEFNVVLNSLQAAGYTNYYSVLNAKDFGIPQNRERVFIISIRNDIDHGFTFPVGYDLKLRLKDMLEDEVDEKYYISDEMLNYLLKTNAEQKIVGNGFKFNLTDGNGIAVTISTKAGSRMTDNFICDNTEPVVDRLFNIYNNDYGTSYGGNVYNVYGISPALLTMQGGNRQPLVVNNKLLRIRKLTPKECFRLMGFDDRDIDILVKNKISNTQLYKMAGNSIVVNVLEEIFKNILNQYADVFSEKESTKKMNILVACEESQAVCKAFREKGHRAFFL